MYNFKEINQRGSCVDFAINVLGIKVTNGRCAATWRGGENPNVSIDKERWYDHVQNIGGGLLELCALTKFNDITATQDAQNFLGDWLGLAEMQLRPTPKTRGNSRYDELLTQGYTETARYNYTTAEGEEKYFVVRMEHPERSKQFLQGTPQGWNLRGVTPLPYNLPAVTIASRVFIVEGEKDVETLRKYGFTATTNSGGAQHWQDSFTELLAGKEIVLLPDNDEAGRTHAEKITDSIARTLAQAGTLESLKVITLSKLPKGDVTDWFEKEGGTQDAFQIAIATAEEKREQLIFTPEELAKRANKEPFSNFNFDGKDKTPRDINELIKDIHIRLLGAPFKVGDTLFDRDKDTGEIIYIYDTAGLFSWIRRKTKCSVDWARLDNCVTKAEFFEGLRAEAKSYSAISFAPDFPMRQDVFYTHPKLPKPTAEHAAFWGFVDKFNPDGDTNRSLLAAFIMTPMFYKPLVNKPLWIIDSYDGQGSGKSKIPEMTALLYGKDEMNGEPLDVTLYDLSKNYYEVVKRMLSNKGRNARIFRVDNATGELRNAQLAALVTTGSISGRPSYGRGEETRPNNLTYVVTINSARVDSDIASRAYYLMVKKPQMRAGWVEEVKNYIEQFRLQIYADIIDILEMHTPFNAQPQTRVPLYETLILQPACMTEAQYFRVLDFITEKKMETNTDEDIARRIEEEIDLLLRKANQRKAYGMPDINSATDKVFIRSDALEEWFARKDWLRGKAISQIRNLANTGMLSQISPTTVKFPHNKNDMPGINRRHGIMWNYQNNNTPRIVGLRGGECMEIDNELTTNILINDEPAF